MQMEMCASDYVIAILSMMDRREGLKRLAQALTEIDKTLERNDGKKKRQEEKDNNKEIPDYQQYRPKTILKISEAFIAQSDYVRLEEAEERIAADFINLYPPGIPILVPGEKIDGKAVEIIAAYLKAGYNVQGIEKHTPENIYYVKAVKE